MLKNYFITALRNFLRYRTQALIQIISLAVGITAAISISLFVLHEFSHDRFQEKADRVYRVEFGNTVGMWPAIGHQITQEIPEVEKVVRLVNWAGKDRIFTSDYSPRNDSLDVRFVEITDFYWCDSTIFDVFTLPLIQGDPATALRDPYSCIISESTSKKIFGDKDPVGEAFWGGGIVITGVFKDIRNSHIDLNMLISMVSLDEMGGHKRGEPGYLNDYHGSHWMTYMLLREGVDRSYMEERIDEFFKQKWKNLFEYEAVNHFHLRPMRDIYFSTGLEGENNTFNHGNLGLLRILIATACFILLLGIINYVNLTTARASLRAREVGIRKVAGAAPSGLFMQFQVEAILVAILSFLIGVGLVAISLPGFRRLTSVDLSMDFLEAPGTWLAILLGVVLLGILSGLYPSMYMTRFQPVESLSGNQSKGRGSLVFRRILLTFQFIISLVLMIGVLVISRQLGFMQNSDPGFNMEGVVNFTGGSHLWHQDHEKRLLIKERLLQFPDVLGVTFSSSISGDNQDVSADPYRMKGIEKHTAWLGIDPDYLDLLEIGLHAGRHFDRDIPGDYVPERGEGLYRVLVNETFIREFELELTGDQIITWENGYQQEIIGVISDFHFKSLHEQIQPTLLAWQDFLPVLAVKIAPGNMQSTLKKIQSELSSIFPELTPDFYKYSFLEQTYARQYEKDERTGWIILNFAIVAILLACLGLFGLAQFMAARRIKEIGIRKTFGASIRSVYLLLATEYIRWILLSAAVACPLSWIIMHRWLQNFAYRTGISWWIFAVAILFAAMITFATVTWQSLKTARTNPVDALRDE